MATFFMEARHAARMMGQAGSSNTFLNVPANPTRLCTFEFVFPTWLVFLPPPTAILHTRFSPRLQNLAEHEQEKKKPRKRIFQEK